MTIPELMDAIDGAEKAGQDITFAVTGKLAPFSGKGWPKGELLCHNSWGGSVWLYDTKKLKAALLRENQRAVNKLVAWRIAAENSKPQTNPITPNPDSEPDGIVDTSFPYGHNLIAKAQESISKAMASQLDALLGGVPVHVRPELPPCTIQMRGDLQEACIETDSMKTAHALVECANENKGGAITYEMLVECYNRTLEGKKHVIGFDLSKQDFANWPLRDTGALHAKRNEIVGQVRDEWKDSEDSTGEGPAPRLHTARCIISKGKECCAGHRLDTNGCMQEGCPCNPDSDRLPSCPTGCGFKNGFTTFLLCAHPWHTGGQKQATYCPHQGALDDAGILWRQAYAECQAFCGADDVCGLPYDSPCHGYGGTVSGNRHRFVPKAIPAKCDKCSSIQEPANPVETSNPNDRPNPTYVCRDVFCTDVACPTHGYPAGRIVQPPCRP